MGSKYSEIEITTLLMKKYREYLREEIDSVVMAQTEDEVLLKTYEVYQLENGLEKLVVDVLDLRFIIEDATEDGEILMFDPQNSIENNVNIFINELTPYSIINTTNLFKEKAEDRISKKYNVFGVDTVK